MFVASMYHYIDQVMSFFGDPVTLRASYSASRDEHGTIERDTGHALLGFDSSIPTVVNIAYSRGFEKPGLGSRKLVVFERGYLEQSSEGMTVRWPDGERELETPANDAMAEDTMRFFELVAGSAEAETPEWAQAALQIACSLQEDAGLSGGRRR
jgi:predicted dehydrogenase